MARRRRVRRQRLSVAGVIVFGGLGVMYIRGVWPFVPPDTPESTSGIAEVPRAAPQVDLTPLTAEANPKAQERRQVAESDTDPSPRVGQEPPVPGRTGEPPSGLQEIRRKVEAGLEARNQGELLTARELLTGAVGVGLLEAEESVVRSALVDIANRTIFSPEHFEGDALTGIHVVQPGEALARIAKRHQVTADCLAYVNGLRDKNRIRIGQRLKVVKGPFNAVIRKRQHLCLVYLHGTLVAEFRVGLGEYGTTPTGEWVAAVKLENPTYYPPASGSGPIIAADDPNNPLGEHWIGFKGVSGEAVGQVGYGIHGTIEPETIGRDVSMGCVRLLNEDIELLYKLMTTGASHIIIE